MNEITYPYVITDFVTVSDEIQRGIAAFLDESRPIFYDLTISNGPYRTWDELALHAHEGPVANHHDGAGITYGLILIANGQHHLKVADQVMPLRAGTFFAINSDDDHETLCDSDGLLALATLDFFHHESNIPIMSDVMRKDWTLREPTLSTDTFAKRALAAAMEWSQLCET